MVARHILRPTLTPIVTILGLDLGALIGGAIVTEVLFGLPGIAQATVKALIDLDLPMIVGVVLTSAFFVIMFNLIVDILYAALDPGSGTRERRAGKERAREAARGPGPPSASTPPTAWSRRSTG